MPEKLAKPVVVPIIGLSAVEIPLRLRSSLALLIVPVALVILSIVLVNAQGPWGANNRSDPEYCYLLNSLSLLTFHVPAHIDHPGTTLQEFGAVVVFCKWIVASMAHGWTSIQRAVLSHPDDYLWPINLGINVILSAAVFFAGLRLYIASGSLPAALMLQFTLFLFRQTLLALPRVSPEPFLIAIGFALMIPLIPTLLGEERNPARASTSAGAVFGFGLVTKVTFLPLAVLAVLVGGRKERRRFAIAAVVTGLIVALPVFSRAHGIVHWFGRLLIHSESYGRGPVGLPAAALWLDHLGALFREEPFIFCSLLYYALVLLAIVFARRDPLTLSIRRLTWVVCAAIGIQLAMTLKHYAVRYMLPSLVICALPNAFIVLWLSSSALPVIVRRSLAVLAVILMAVGLWSSQRAVAGWVKGAIQNQAEVRILDRVRLDQRGCLTIGYYQSSSPGFALAFGNDYAGGVHGKVLEELYPNFIFYDKFDREFQSWTSDPSIAQVQRMVADGRCVLLQGEPSSKVPFSVEPEFSIELIAQQGDQAIYRLHPGSPR